MMMERHENPSPPCEADATTSATHAASRTHEVWTWWKVLLLWLLAIGWFFLVERCITWADLGIEWLGYPRHANGYMNVWVGDLIRAGSRFVIRVFQGLGLFFLLALPVKSWFLKLPQQLRGLFPAYHTAFRFVVHATFPSDAEPEPGGFGSWSDVRKWATWAGYYSAVISLPTTRRLFYVTFNPFLTQREEWKGAAGQAGRRTSFFPTPRRIIEKARIYIETELFPHNKVRLKELKLKKPDEYGEEIARQYLANLKRYDEGEGPFLECESCFDFFGDNSEPIRAYFQAQEELQAELGEAPGFLSHIKVETGYLSPTFLISGPLDEFDEDWTRIVRGYNDKMVALTKDDPFKSPEPLHDLRKLQSFIWDCWVQWGPSVSLCNHNDWTTGNLAIQFGYGDENNSLPLVFKPPQRLTSFQWSDWADSNSILWKFKHRLGYAWPAVVTGRLKWYRHEERNAVFCSAQSDKRLGIDQDEEDNGWLVFEAESIDPDSAPPLYYSAYIWVLIAVCCDTTHDPYQDSLDQAANELYAQRRYRLIHSKVEDHWRCLIPFFQHGNVAEATVFDDIKRELAYKTIDTLVEQLDRADKAGVGWLHFAFVAAYDDNGDESQTLVASPGEKSIAGWLTEAYAARTEALETRAKLLRHQGIETTCPNSATMLQQDERTLNLLKKIHLEHDALTELSASDLPQIVRIYLDQLPE